MLVFSVIIILTSAFRALVSMTLHENRERECLSPSFLWDALCHEINLTETGVIKLCLAVLTQRISVPVLFTFMLLDLFLPVYSDILLISFREGNDRVLNADYFDPWTCRCCSWSRWCTHSATIQSNKWYWSHPHLPHSGCDGQVIVFINITFWLCLVSLRVKELYFSHQILCSFSTHIST